MLPCGDHLEHGVKLCLLWAETSPFRFNLYVQGQGTIAGGENQVSVPNSASIRQPSATMAVVLVAQIQFLATLSLVDNTGAEESTLSDFAENLR